ncbi:YeeE/YedE family protein [Rhodovastum atsumiense]|uniref:YeeE/YedE family protein n=1 Tax=Rhodovastum atsumiense TaxID=504468 RepID=A0A5M6J3A2_9PROT|nr:YeeE/YedE family protein [Rhodovastum atsumiense]KAA5614709.1 YeeE/YedE family protein [Rhodovastum atsumiense]CAH2599757.1 YeeE/YedE family protein [Rhodovastum atsumiense]
MSGSVFPSRILAIPSAQPLVAAAAVLGFAALSLAIAQVATPRMVALLLIGGLLGMALYHASFGFTSAYRGFLAERRSAGLRAQFVMLALATLLFFPVLAQGSLFGQPVIGNVAPLGPSVVIGAFLFGVGMQLGAGCASGTLFTVGGGNLRMVVTLAFFILGSVVGVAHIGWWQALPGLPAVSLVSAFGWPVALAVNLAVFAALFLLVQAAEYRRHGTVAPIGGTMSARRFLVGPWPILLGGIALALLNFATLAVAGKPWGITSAFGIWGAKLLAPLGLDVSHWGSWAEPAYQRALSRPVLADVTSVMDFGIMLGALLAAGLAGRFAPSLRIPARHLLASVIGGLLMGYGARLAYGCNIGAFFSGIASGSLHGWLWIALAIAGSAVGIRLRPVFGMDPPRRNAAC